MSTAADARSLLKACEDTAKQIADINVKNKELKKKHDYDWASWNQRKIAHSKKVERWSQRTGEYAKYVNAGKEFEIGKACLERNVEPCPSGSSHVRFREGPYDWTKACHHDHRICRWDGSWEYNNSKPGNFSEAEPKFTSLPVMTSFTCCPNVIVSKNSTINDSTINQINNCISDIRTQVEKKETAEKAAAEKAAEEKAAEEKAAAEKAVAEKAVAEKAVAEKAVAAEIVKSNNNKYIIGGGVSFFSSLSSFLISILLIISIFLM